MNTRKTSWKANSSRSAQPPAFPSRVTIVLDTLTVSRHRGTASVRRSPLTCKADDQQEPCGHRAIENELTQPVGSTRLGSTGRGMHGFANRMTRLQQTTEGERRMDRANILVVVRRKHSRALPSLRNFIMPGDSETRSIKKVYELMLQLKSFVDWSRSRASSEAPTQHHRGYRGSRNGGQLILEDDVESWFGILGRVKEIKKIGAHHG
jgi:hypothetical protein